MWGIWQDYDANTSICFFEKGKPHPTEYKIYFNAKDIAIAQDGNIWLALAGGYIVEISPEALEKNDFTELKVIRIDGETDQFVQNYPIIEFGENRPRIEIGLDNVIWIKGKNKLYSFDGKKWVMEQQDVLDFTVNSVGEVWAGLANELRKFDGNEWVSYPYSDDCICPTQLTIGADDSVWFLQECEKVFKFNERNKTFSPVDKTFNGITLSQILSAPDGAMWFIYPSKWFRYQEKK